MKAIELTAPSLDAFRPAVLPDPTPGPGEILVRLRAATLNYLDIAIATGNFPVPAFPMIPVADGAGEVAAVGANVAAMRGISLPGSLAEYVVVPESGLVALPSHLDFAQGAALPVAGTTAWNAVRSAQVRPGSTVVILGTGGVSIFALQFAKASGATVIVTSSSDEKLERAKQLGADLLINYRSTPEWNDEVLRLTDGRGADLVVDTVGEATFARSLKAAAFGGTVFTVGFLTGVAASIDLFSIIGKALKIVGNNTGSVADLAEAARATTAQGIVPVLDQIFDFGETSLAYSKLAAGGQHFGKIAIFH